MVQLYSCLIMFLLPVIIIPYESLFLKMRNRHSLLKVLNPYSLAKRNTLCLSKIPKIPLYPRLLQKFLSPCSEQKSQNPPLPVFSPKLLLAPLTKFPKSLLPASSPKFHLLPKFSISLLSKILFSRCQRSIYMGIDRKSVVQGRV